MAGTLRVTPGALRQAAASERDSAAAVSKLEAGAALGDGATGMSGLASGAACTAVGTVFDSEGTAVGTELDRHADNLGSAADRYEQVDSDYGKRLRGMTR
jgi:Excreted virulence factor EspC, type VII ESX diderm